MKTRHIIAVGLLSALAVGLLAFGISKSKYKPKTLQTNADNTITNLTNTTWTINNIPTRPFYDINCDINFTSNNNNFTKIFMNHNAVMWAENGILYDTTPVYSGENNTWVSESYRTITITNGADITNANLIEWLTNNATQENTDYITGYNAGYTDGYTAGQTAGYQTGYGIGYNDSEAFNHPIDFAPMMLNILTMPFTFISQAFDVTLWPGTQYQINIGNFIKAMIAISAILFIIRLFTSGFSIIGNYSANVQNHKLTKQKIAESKARTNLINRTDPNHKTSHKTSVNVNHNYKHKE